MTDPDRSKAQEIADGILHHAEAGRLEERDREAANSLANITSAELAVARAILDNVRRNARQVGRNLEAEEPMMSKVFAAMADEIERALEKLEE